MSASPELIIAGCTEIFANLNQPNLRPPFLMLYGQHMDRYSPAGEDGASLTLDGGLSYSTTESGDFITTMQSRRRSSHPDAIFQESISGKGIVSLSRYPTAEELELAIAYSNLANQDWRAISGFPLKDWGRFIRTLPITPITIVTP